MKHMEITAQRQDTEHMKVTAQRQDMEYMKAMEQRPDMPHMKGMAKAPGMPEMMVGKSHICLKKTAHMMIMCRKTMRIPLSMPR